MSHFSVLVVTDTPEQVAAALQPFHEFECTGTSDQYVQDVDITADCIKEYAEYTDTMLVNAETGEKVSAYDDRFYREPTEEEIKKHGVGGKLMGTGCGGGISYTSKDWGDGKGYRGKIRHVPEGWSEQEVPTAENRSLVQWIKDYYGKNVVSFGEQPDLDDTHKHGYVLVDEDGKVVKVVNRTNPNAEWDWWVMGGRFSGTLRSKVAAVKGRPGAMGSEHDPFGVDQCRKSDLDLEGMKAENIRQAGEVWDGIQKEPKGIHVMFNDTYKPGMTKEQYIEAVMENKPLGFSTFAVLMDGKWHERGDMGWWGIVRDDKSDWKGTFADLFNQIPDGKLLTVVDCHI